MEEVADEYCKNSQRGTRAESFDRNLDFANGIFDEFIELHGDRSFRDDGAVIGGIGWLR